jgi:hypothetical protein
MSHAAGQLSGVLLSLQENHNALQFLICAVGTLAGIFLIIGAFALCSNRQQKSRAVSLAFILLLIMGFLSSFAPLGSLNGDGAVHQEKVWFISQAMRQGSLPEWSFFWFGGGVVNEFYGPLYYVLFAIPMVIFGLTSKWAIALIVVGCSAVAAALIVRFLSPKYGMLAAALAAACHVFSPARTGAYWYDGTPHRLVIDFICLIYVLYLWRNLAKASAWHIGLFLGTAASACVYFHLQFGGMATALLFMFTAVALGFDRGIDLKRPLIASVTGLAVVLPTAGLHYLYYFLVKADFVASADSLVYMVAPVTEWLQNLAVASLWDWGSHSWEMHYFGAVPVTLSLLALVCLFRVDRFSFFSGMFAVLVFLGSAVVPRLAVFGPVFFVPTVAAVVHHVRSRVGQNWSNDRIRWAGLALSLAALLDIYPSAFQLPYRPGSGDRPVAEALAAIGPSRGRIVVSSPDKQYENNAADRFPGYPQVNSPTIFGPTFQLSTRMLGYAAMISRRAWMEFEATGTLGERIRNYLALLDVSDVLLYERDKPVVHVSIANFRPAWRIEKFICDPAAGPLTKLNWDELRALGLGLRKDPFDNDSELTIDAALGTVGGVRIDCGPEGAAQWTEEISAQADAPDTVSEVHYGDGTSTAEFSIDASRPGLFLLPFGYAADLRVGAGGEKLAVARTNEWMSVIALPAGHSDIRMTAAPRQMVPRRAMDAVFVILLIGIAISSVSSRRRQLHDGVKTGAGKAG